MNYIKTTVAIFVVALLTMGIAAAGSTVITYCGTGSYVTSWSGSNGEITINTYTPEGSDTFYSNFEDGSTSGYQSMDSDYQRTTIYRSVDMTDGYTSTRTESISGMFEERSYASSFRQRAIFTPRFVSVFDW